MNKYIIYHDAGEPSQTHGRPAKTSVLRQYGMEAGIPVYEHYRSFVGGGKGPSPIERAGDLIRRLEATV